MTDARYAAVHRPISTCERRQYYGSKHKDAGGCIKSFPHLHIQMLNTRNFARRLMALMCKMSTPHDDGCLFGAA